MKELIKITIFSHLQNLNLRQSLKTKTAPQKENVRELFNSKGSIYGQNKTHLREYREIYSAEFSPSSKIDTKTTQTLTGLVQKFSKGEIDSDKFKTKLKEININSDATEVPFFY